MIAAGQQKGSDIRHHRHVFQPIDRRMEQRRGASPIFIRRVGVEDLRHELGFQFVREQAVASARLGIELRHIAERKDIRRVKEIQIRMSIARGLCEAMIEAAAAAAGHVRHHSVERLSMRFVFVEAVIKIRAQKTAALRNTERDRLPDVALFDRQFRSAAILQLRNRIADRSRTEADDCRILRFVHDFIDLVFLEHGRDDHTLLSSLNFH